MNTQSAELWRTIIRRALAGILAILWIIVPYGLAQNFATREIIWVKPSAIDLAIPVNFHGLWFYLSFYGLLGWIGLSIEDSVYKRYITSVFWIALFSHFIFFIVPNGVSREAIEPESAPIVYQWLVFADRPRNAFPSLHASLSILAGLVAFSSPKTGPIYRIIIWLWIIGILWSTISLRQHYAFDLITGGTLATTVWFAVTRTTIRSV